MCAYMQNDVLRVPIFQFFTCLLRHVLGVLCVKLLGLCVLYAFCALYALSKPYVQHCWLQKRASGQKGTDGSQRNIYCSSGVLANRSRGALASAARTPLERKFFRLQNQVKTMKL